jgi:hypothetical protein
MSDWKTLAITEANAVGCANDIMLATVEAETGGRNISGDSGNALGYGQVWVKWHRYAFEEAGAELGISVPSALGALTIVTLGNDQFSMRVAAKVIKRTWESVNGDWAKFTYKYVGPGIPASDFTRRQNIWNKYHNSNFDYSGTSSFINQSSSIEIPSTNYEVVKGSAKSKNLLYGRKYRIIVSLNGTTALDVSDMRCTFKCVKTALMEPNYSEVVIYNLSAKTENAIIQEGSRIIIEAGYEGDQYGIVFDGNVLQPIREKEDGNTYKLTLIAIDGDAFYNGGFIVSSLVKGQTARNIVDNCTKKASVSAQSNFISDSLSGAKLTRGKVLFGLSRDYIRQVAKSNDATFYLDDGKVNIIKATDFKSNEIVELSPASGLIGVPSQLNYGVSGKCLLNPRIKLNSLVHIDNSLIRAQQATQTAQYSLDNDGIYRVIKVTYTGDTRGNDWYTEFETVSQSGAIPSMLSSSSGSMW